MGVRILIALPSCVTKYTQSAALYEIIQKVKLVEFLLLYDVFNTL